jgi:ribosomal protein L10
VADVQRLATLPPKPALQAQLAGTIQSPLSNLVGLLNSALGELVRVLDAREAQLGESA